MQPINFVLQLITNCSKINYNYQLCTPKCQFDYSCKWKKTRLYCDPKIFYGTVITIKKHILPNLKTGGLGEVLHSFIQIMVLSWYLLQISKLAGRYNLWASFKMYIYESYYKIYIICISYDEFIVHTLWIGVSVYIVHIVLIAGQYLKMNIIQTSRLYRPDKKLYQFSHYWWVYKHYKHINLRI